ncbi:hypothetical protein [Haloferula helveola]
MKKLVQQAIRNDTVWRCIDRALGSGGPLHRKLLRSRSRLPGYGPEREAFVAKFGKAFPQRAVCHGPFAGMRYPEEDESGRTVYPKLLGSYERELGEVIESVIARQPSAIVDIGCAEGYYAVGFGMRCPDTRIFAFDNNDVARACCEAMAQLNGVEVRTGEFCDRETLLGLDLGERGLVFSDCEGYENKLFDRSVAERMAVHDFLIEAHDFIEPGTTERMLEAFDATHDCRVIESVDDLDKASGYDFPELDGFEFGERYEMLAEWRPETMRWVYAEAK